jgi:hypothetical protein
MKSPTFSSSMGGSRINPQSQIEDICGTRLNCFEHAV